MKIQFRYFAFFSETWICVSVARCLIWKTDWALGCRLAIPTPTTTTMHPIKGCMRWLFITLVVVRRGRGRDGVGLEAPAAARRHPGMPFKRVKGFLMYLMKKG